MTMDQYVTKDSVKEDSQMGDASFKVVFWGQPAAGVTQQDLAQRFARLFKIRSAQQLQRFFSGRIQVLKSGLTEAQARSWSRALSAIGAQCRVERNQVIGLQGEVAQRDVPSFLQPGLTADQMSMSAIEPETPDLRRQVAQREPSSKSRFEARDVSGR